MVVRSRAGSTVDNESAPFVSEQVYRDVENGVGVEEEGRRV